MSERSASAADPRPRGRDLALLAILAVGSWLLAELAVSAGVEAAVIPTLTALAVRHFRHRQEAGEQEPKHPAVKFVLAAWNEGDFTDAEKHVARDCVVYTNGFAYDPGLEGDGAGMAKEGIEYWRTIAPDLEMGLSREIREKDRIALEWSITGTHTGGRPELPATGNAIELQGSAFLALEDDKIVEVWTVFDSLALAVQTGATEAPAWWPGRNVKR
jgi:SnoaL-like polyketide cyclase